MEIVKFLRFSNYKDVPTYYRLILEQGRRCKCKKPKKVIIFIGDEEENESWHVCNECYKLIVQESEIELYIDPNDIINYL